jgi:hypothetical protein
MSFAADLQAHDHLIFHLSNGRAFEWNAGQTANGFLSIHNARLPPLLNLGVCKVR